MQDKFGLHKVMAEPKTEQELKELAARLDNQLTAAKGAADAAAALAFADGAATQPEEVLGPVQTESTLLAGLTLDEPASKKPKKTARPSSSTAAASAAGPSALPSPNKPASDLPALTDVETTRSVTSRGSKTKRSKEIQGFDDMDSEMQQVAELHCSTAGKSASVRSLVQLTTQNYLNGVKQAGKGHAFQGVRPQASVDCRCSQGKL